MILAALVLASVLSQAPVRAIAIGEINQENIDVARAQFDARVVAEDKEIVFAIDSPGGEVFTGLEFIQHVAKTKADYGITTICAVQGNAMSMALVFLESPACDVRLATSSSLFLAHGASGGVSGNADKMEEAAEFTRALNTALFTMIAERIGMPYELFYSKVEKRSWIFAAKEAYAYGFLDGLLPSFTVIPTY